MWLLLFIVFVTISCSSTYLSVHPFNQPSFFLSFLPSCLPCIHNSYRLSLYSSFHYFWHGHFPLVLYNSTFVCKGFLSINQWPGALSIQPKLSKIWKQRQMVQKLFRNCWISEMWTIQPKILEIQGAKLNGKKKFGYTSRGCPLFWKFWKILFHSLLKVAENSNWTFWLNGKRPRLTGETFRG